MTFGLSGFDFDFRFAFRFLMRHSFRQNLTADFISSAMRPSRRLLFSNVPTSPSAYSERSAVTRLLWDKRAVANSVRTTPATLHAPIDRHPADSFLSVVLPFSTDKALREEYISPFNHVRIGRLLEDLDAFAGNIAFAHVSPSVPTLVTASIGTLDLIPKFVNPDEDLQISGNVTSVGGSSMEIRIDAYQEKTCILSTLFYFVARCPESGKSAQVNRLVAETDLDRQRMNQGILNKEKRLRAKANSLHVGLPTTEELEIIHSFFMDESKEKIGTPKKTVDMGSTHQRSLILCSHQQRNIHNKIFGGYLCRSAFELAFSTAYMFSGRRPYFSALGDVTFNSPVEIGSILDLRSAVVYTEKNDVQVHVTARVHRPEDHTIVKTNDFAFSFDLYDDDMREVLCGAQVQPKSYSEAMAFIEGRRKLHTHRKVD